jgi:3-methylcrotonyl-CoA carboxylase alpha subunit
VEQRGAQYRVVVAGKETWLEGKLDGDTLHYEVNGHRRRGILARTHNSFTLYLPEGACHFHEVLADTGEADSAGGDNALKAPMNGTVVTLLAQVGATVEANTPLLVMEAMKMEHTIRAPGPGTIQAFFYAPGDLVAGGAPLLDFVSSQE